MMKPILDATAGNRMMWRHADYNPPNIVFLDKEPSLRRKPDILATWRNLPFRDGVFDCIIFDPPHGWGFGETSLHSEPQGKAIKGKGSWWGNPENKRELILDIIHGQKEFARVSNRLCLKWNDYYLPLFNILSCFTEWKEILTKEYKRTGKLGKSKTWWVTFIRDNCLPRSVKDEN